MMRKKCIIYLVSAMILAMCSCKYDNNNTTDSTFYGNSMDVKKVSTVELDAHILHLSLPNTTQMSMSRVIYLGAWDKSPRAKT